MLPEILRQNLNIMLAPRRRRRPDDFGRDPNADYGDGPLPEWDSPSEGVALADQEPSKPAESYLPSIFRPGARPLLEVPPIEFGPQGQPLKPKLSEDRTIALHQRYAYDRALKDYDPKNNNSKIKSALIGLGRGALQGFAAGGPGGALFGAAAGGIQSAVDPSTDEKYARRRALGQVQSEIDADLKRRKLDQEYDDAMSQRDLQGAQAENLRSLPGRERDRHWESLRKDLVSTYNDLVEYDPQKSPQLAKALLTFGIDAPAKSRAKNTQIVIDQKTGEARVVATDLTSGTATAAPVMAGEKPLVTTTGPMMSKELQEDRQKFQTGQQENRQIFQRDQRQGRESYGQRIFNERKRHEQQQQQQRLVTSIDTVRNSLKRISQQMAELQGKPGSEKDLAALKKNQAALFLRGEEAAAQLNALGDYEAGLGEGNWPYYKERPGRVVQQSGPSASKRWSASRWSQANPGKDVEAAKRAAASKGFQVVE